VYKLWIFLDSIWSWICIEHFGQVFCHMKERIQILVGVQSFQSFVVLSLAWWNGMAWTIWTLKSVFLADLQSFDLRDGLILWQKCKLIYYSLMIHLQLLLNSKSLWHIGVRDHRLWMKKNRVRQVITFEFYFWRNLRINFESSWIVFDLEYIVKILDKYFIIWRKEFKF
jgi:hypothetical protein